MEYIYIYIAYIHSLITLPSQESQHNDLEILKERLNQLDDSQRQQMDNLKTFQTNLHSNIIDEIH